MTVAFLIDVVVPATLIVLMTTLGMNLGLSELAGALRRPRLWLTITLLQFVLLPPCAILIVTVLGVEPVLAISLIAIAAAPGGTLSNVFTFLAGGNLSLSIVLTGASTVLATFLSPFLFAAAAGTLGLSADIHGLHPQAVARDLAAVVLLPLTAGMLISRVAPRISQAVRRIASIGASAAVIGLVAMAAIVSAPVLSQTLPAMLAAGGLLTLCAFGIGAAVSNTFVSQDRLATTIEFGVRNLPVALLLVGGTVPDERTIAYLLGYFIVSAPLFCSQALFCDARLGTSHPDTGAAAFAALVAIFACPGSVGPVIDCF